MAKTLYARINEQGEIVLPAHLARDLGISPGDEIRIEPNGHGMYVHPPVHTLKRVYVEALTFIAVILTLGKILNYTFLIKKNNWPTCFIGLADFM